MPQPKKVAIIGAGPSGLVTAKTLLHDCPKGSFEPTVFEKRHVLGGLWAIVHDGTAAVAGHGKDVNKWAGTVGPLMRTNQSRFTVAFSDLSWESVMGDDVPMFPLAWQAGRYLTAYADKYIPRELLKFGCTVVHTERKPVNDDGDSWTVEWVEGEQRSEDDTHGQYEMNPNNSNSRKRSERFHYLVVASGYFSRPYISHIPGLAELQYQVIHSAALHNMEAFLAHVKRTSRPGFPEGKLIVVGGSMSGVEAASNLAFHLSSTSHEPGSSSQRWKGYTVHHVSARPFWSVPTYLPKASLDGLTGAQTMSFLPLDLIMNDLSRRPPGPVDYFCGPVPPQRCVVVNNYIRSLVGTDQEDLGGGSLFISEEVKERPAWIAVSDTYAEFVRSGAIEVMIGRASVVNRAPTGTTLLEIRHANGDRTLLDNVAAIVISTGFTPFESLSFLPNDILSLLEYSDDAWLPVILDGKGSTNFNVPDLGFVGMYRGPFWGVMEMQARSLAQQWTQAQNARLDGGPSIPSLFNEEHAKTEERQQHRNLRNAGPGVSRAQFPMGDYVGLMETFARDLGLSRFRLPQHGERDGPIIPARYTLPSLSECTEKPQEEVTITISALQAVISAGVSGHCVGRMSAAKAIFHALHGKWKISRQVRKYSDGLNDGISEASLLGTAYFHPRYPSDPRDDYEYLYEEVINQNEKSFIYRLREPSMLENGHDHIRVWTVDKTNTADTFSHGLRFNATSAPLDEEQPSLTFAFQAVGHKRLLDGYLGGDDDPDSRHHECKYSFHMKGVAISSWEVVAYRALQNDDCHNDANNENPQLWLSRMQYTR